MIPPPAHVDRRVRRHAAGEDAAIKGYSMTLGGRVQATTRVVENVWTSAKSGFLEKNEIALASIEPKQNRNLWTSKVADAQNVCYKNC